MRAGASPEAVSLAPRAIPGRFFPRAHLQFGRPHVRSRRTSVPRSMPGVAIRFFSAERN